VTGVRKKGSDASRPVRAVKICVDDVEGKSYEKPRGTATVVRR
jgi:hypothetical protein